MIKNTRRRFLWAFSGGTACAAIGAIAGSRYLGGRVAATTVTRDSWALGSEISITAVHENRTSAQLAVDAAFVEIERVEEIMSIYRPSSQLSRLNRDKCLTQPDPRLVHVLENARNISELSNGAFDVTVQPWSLYRESQESGQSPTANAVRIARSAVGYRNVETRETVVRLSSRATQVTLNGIAQGFALDQAAQALARHGVANAMIDTGEIGACGYQSDHTPWKAGIQHPRQQDAFIAIAPLDGRCLATSGDYATSFADDYSTNHLFDPKTGRSPSELASVSVLASSGVLADSLSTAICVLGVDGGLKLLSAVPNVDALFVLKGGRTLATDGFPMESA